jgi:hypothetical protein
VARQRLRLHPPFVILVAALLLPFLCYLVADPDLDLFAHYDKGNHQVEVQLTVLSAAQRAARLRLCLGQLSSTVQRMLHSAFRSSTKLHCTGTAGTRPPSLCEPLRSS